MVPLLWGKELAPGESPPNDAKDTELSSSTKTLPSVDAEGKAATLPHKPHYVTSSLEEVFPALASVG